jgi:hypothetical protein
MTRATHKRNEMRLARKGDKPPYQKGYATGWTQGRTQLANALASPEGFVTTTGETFRLLKCPTRMMVEGDIYSAYCMDWAPVPVACEMCGDAPCQGCNKCCGSKLGRDPEDGSCLGCG